jgi:hypothetical protein
MDRIQFFEGDTDCMFWGIAGSLDENNEQGFKHVIIDEDFYNENVYKLFPSDFFSSDNSNPTFENKTDRKLFDKKLGGLDVEKQSDCVIADAPKVYTWFDLEQEAFSKYCCEHKINAWKSSYNTVDAFTHSWKNGYVPNINHPWKTKNVRNKGVKQCQNNLKAEDYYKALRTEDFYKLNKDEISDSLERCLIKDSPIINGANSNLQLHKGVMSKITMNKNILTAAHTKYRVSDDFITCLPLYLETQAEKEKMKEKREFWANIDRREGENRKLIILKAEQTELEEYEQPREEKTMRMIDKRDRGKIY